MEIPSCAPTPGLCRKLSDDDAKVKGHFFRQGIVATDQSLQLALAELESPGVGGTLQNVEFVA